MWPPNLQQAVLRLPTSKAPEVALGGSSSFVLPTTPDVNSFAGFPLTPPPTLVCVCLFVSLRTPGPPRSSLASGVLHPRNLFSGRCIQQPTGPRATVLSSHPPLALVQDVCVAADWLRRQGRDGEQRQHPVYDISGSKYPSFIGLPVCPRPLSLPLG